MSEESFKNHQKQVFVIAVVLILSKLWYCQQTHFYLIAYYLDFLFSLYNHLKRFFRLVGNRIFGLSLSTINALYANAEKQIENKWKFEESKSELLKKHNCYVDDNDEDSNARRIFNRIYGSDDDLLDDDQGNSENLNGENSESHQNDSIVESEDERMSSSTEEEEEDNIEENRSEFKFEESKIEQNVSIVEPKDEIMSNLTEEEDNVDENGIRVEQSKSFKNKS